MGQSLSDGRTEELQTSCQQQEVLDLASWASGNMNKPAVIRRTRPRASFNQIARHWDRRSSNLCL